MLASVVFDKGKTTVLSVVKPYLWFLLADDQYLHARVQSSCYHDMTPYLHTKASPLFSQRYRKGAQ